MSCNCNTADPNCEPCAFCTPPGVRCLPDCNPEDPCPEKIDLCCVLNSGPDHLCSDIENGQPLCELIEQFLEIEFPESVCCVLEMSIDLLSEPITPTTTTSTTTSTTSTTSTTTTTTKIDPPNPPALNFCFTSTGCSFACSCVETESVVLYSNCTTLAPLCVLYTNTSLTTTASPGYYGAGGKCYIVSSTGVITAISNCVNPIELCYTRNFLDISTICNCSQTLSQ